MNSWVELREILEHLSHREDRPLQGWPDPRIEDRNPPFRIRLAPWATEIARQLHDAFGEQVDLTVGALHYPEGRRLRPDGTDPPARPAVAFPLLPAEEVSVSLDEPLVVMSGHTVTSHLRVYNHQDHIENVSTNGNLTARIVNPDTADTVGGYAGAQTLPSVRFRIEPGASKLIPLLVGTASTVGELGYAVPPGTWAFETRISLQAGDFRTPLLPITILASPPPQEPVD